MKKLKLSVVVTVLLIVSLLITGTIVVAGGFGSENDETGFAASNGLTHHDHDHSVEIEGRAMKLLTVQEIADLWEIDAQTLLNRIIEEFDFKGDYAIETTLEEMRLEYKFSPALIKDIAEEIKQTALKDRNNDTEDAEITEE